MSTVYYNALTVYDNIVNDDIKLREAVRYFFAKYPEEARDSIAPRDESGEPVRYLNGFIIHQHDIRYMRNLGNKIEAIKYCRNLHTPHIGLKDAKDFVEQYCM